MMRARPPRILLFIAFIGSILAGVFPVGLSIRELASLGASVQQIDAASSVARQAREVADKIALGITDFTAIVIDLDPAERVGILSETDRNVAEFGKSVIRLRHAVRQSLNDQQDRELADAAESLAYSWSEIRDEAAGELSSSEKAYHFLQIAYHAKKARGVLLDVEARTSSLADAQTRLAIDSLRVTGALLVTAIIVGFLINTIGSLSIFWSLRSAQSTNAKLLDAEAALSLRSEQLVEAQRLGKLGEWSYRFGEPEVWLAAESYDLLGYNSADFRPTHEVIMSLSVGGSARLFDTRAEAVRTRSTRSVDIKFQRADGSIADLMVTTKPTTDADGHIVGISGTIQDISERKRAEEQLEKLAYYDPLTGLANRALFHRKMTDVIGRYGRTRIEGAMLLLDLDRFKEVNDSLGHAAGDELLVRVGHLLSRAVGKQHFLARIGGDEFVIVMPECDDETAIAGLAARVVAAVSGSIGLERGEVAIGTSIGIVRFPLDGSNLSDLLRNADLALYRAKEDGRGCFRFFLPGMNAVVQHKMALARDLRRAVSEGTELAVHYQPQIDLVTGRVTGYEALMRWNHPTRGNVPPSEFIPIAESSHLICDLGLWILRQSALQAKAWLDAGEPPREVAVNVSAAQIWHTDLLSEVAGVLKEADLPPNLLCLELTESLMADHAEGRVRTVLGALKELGVTLALDDFGTNYSSLGYLKQLPFDKLKIDRMFVDRISESRHSRELLKGIIALGRGLGMTVQGEGAETIEEVAILHEFGCDLVQGYVFARPTTAADALAFTHAWEAMENGGDARGWSDQGTDLLVAKLRAVAAAAACPSVHPASQVFATA